MFSVILHIFCLDVKSSDTAGPGRDHLICVDRSGPLGGNSGDFKSRACGAFFNVKHVTAQFCEGFPPTTGELCSFCARVFFHSIVLLATTTVTRARAIAFTALWFQCSMSLDLECRVHTRIYLSAAPSVSPELEWSHFMRCCPRFVSLTLAYAFRRRFFCASPCISSEPEGPTFYRYCPRFVPLTLARASRGSLYVTMTSKGSQNEKSASSLHPRRPLTEERVKCQRKMTEFSRRTGTD